MARLFQRGRRWWGDFRDFSAVGGGREPLAPPGSGRATEDRNLAAQLFAARLKELENVRDDVARGRPAAVTLGTFAVEHLAAKREAAKVTPDWMDLQAVFLERALEFLGPGRRLTSVQVEDLERWIAALRERPVKGASRPLSEGSIRHHLNAVSGLYRRAQSRGLVPPGFNPVAALLEKPQGRRGEAAWLEVHEAALLLETARRMPRLVNPRALPFEFELLATLMLTGGRLDEVLGLELEDISFDRKTVRFRWNEWRRMKNRGSNRVIPMWPQLEEILRPYVDRRTAAEVLEDAPARRLLFPAPFAKDRERKLFDIQKTIDRIAIAAGFREPVIDPATKEQAKDKFGRLRWRGTVFSKMLRHGYVASRLQTLDRGQPVSLYTVRREMGHKSDAMVNEVYGHLGQIRHRSEVVEFRLEQHVAALAPRLAALPDTTSALFPEIVPRVVS